MSDNFENNNYYSNNNSTSDSHDTNEIRQNENKESNTFSGTKENGRTYSENSYEWNSEKTGGDEYHYSYVNGNNVNAAHNPNKYDSIYADTASSTNSGESNPYSYTQGSNYNNSDYSGNTQQSQYTNYSNNNSYGNYAQQGYSNSVYASGTQKQKKPKKVKVQKPKKPASKGFVAAMLIISIIASGAVGFGGGYLANQIAKSSGGGININQVAADSTSTKSNASLSGTTSEIVKKTADSVVEIATEAVVTGGFAQQYIQKGAGSGVIISEDGYIITNYHVIEGAKSINVTLRDGTKSYTAALIGSDEENDIALIKVDASGLSPATFGDSSKIAVGDYVVAIGNPLGELGGTVTDGIVSALAREVTVEGNNMTLLQHNAQISPGNSGGGLFNAKGELIGIVNAKDSATEVEGIAFAIPVNNVLDIINDLKSYGYVTGKIDLGMELTDITSQDTAFYYGVNNTGCYVLSVTKGSNADAAGFHTGDLIIKVNGTEVSKSTDIKSVLKDSKVGDTVKFTVYRSGKTVDLELTLDEYIPSRSKNNLSSNDRQQSDSIWNDMFGY